MPVTGRSAVPLLFTVTVIVELEPVAIEPKFNDSVDSV